MAIAERFVRTRFGADICDHRTFVFAGDGCFMEGIPTRPLPSLATLVSAS